MDHVIDYIQNYMNCYDVGELANEYKSGLYKKLSDCPSYSTVKAYCDAINILTKACYNAETAKMYCTSPSKEIELYLE